MSIINAIKKSSHHITIRKTIAYMHITRTDKTYKLAKIKNMSIRPLDYRNTILALPTSTQHNRSFKSLQKYMHKECQSALISHTSNTIPLKCTKVALHWWTTCKKIQFILRHAMDHGCPNHTSIKIPLWPILEKLLKKTHPWTRHLSTL